MGGFAYVRELRAIHRSCTVLEPQLDALTGPPNEVLGQVFDENRAIAFGSMRSLRKTARNATARDAQIAQRTPKREGVAAIRAAQLAA
jgi:hypothetical protein